MLPFVRFARAAQSCAGFLLSWLLCRTRLCPCHQSQVLLPVLVHRLSCFFTRAGLVSDTAGIAEQRRLSKGRVKDGL